MSRIRRAAHSQHSVKSKREKKDEQPGMRTVLPIYLERVILILACLILFLPLVVDNDFYYPQIFLKSILFRVAVQAMAFIYVVLAATSAAHRPRLNRITYALLAYFGSMIFSSLPGLSVNAWSSWYGSFARMGGVYAQLHLLAYFFVLTHALKRERHWLVLFTGSLFSGVLMGTTGLIQYLRLDYLYRFNDYWRIKGATGNANFLAAYMVINFFIALWFLSRRDKKDVFPVVARIWLILLGLMDLGLILWEAKTAAVGPGILSTGLFLAPIALFTLFLHAASLAWFFLRQRVAVGGVFFSVLGVWYLFWMYQSQTRSAVVGLAGSLAFLSFFYLWAKVAKSVKWTTVGLTSAAFLLMSVVFLNRQSAWVQRHPPLVRLTTYTFGDTGPRLLAWKAGAQAMLDHPFFGWGPENYNSAFDRHFPPQMFMQLDFEQWFDRAHNMIMDIGTTTGLLGLATYICFFALVLAFLAREWLRTRDLTNGILIAALLLAYLFQSLFTFDTMNTDVLVFLVLAYVAHLCGGKEGQSSDSTGRNRHRLRVTRLGWVSIAAAAALLFSAFWHVVEKPYRSNLFLSQAMALQKVRELPSQSARYVYREEIVDLYRTASDLQTTGRYEVREEFANYVSELARASYIPLEVRVRLVRRALESLEESIRQNPSVFRHHMYPVTLVNRTFEILHSLDSGLAGSLAEKNLILLNEAEKLSPTRPQLFIERAQTLVFLGRPQDAITALETAIQLSPVVKEPHIDLVTLYISVGRYDEAAREWQRIKGLSPPPTASDYERVIRSYYGNRHFAPIVVLYREQLEKTPDDAVLLSRLASAYRDIGDMESARQTALKAAALSPEVAAGLQTFLDSVAQPR